MKKTATFVRVLNEWAAPTILFKLNKPFEGHDTLVIAAARSVFHFEMLIYLCKKNNIDYKYSIFREPKKYRVVKCDLPQFAEALKQIGYKMVGYPKLYPRRISK